jgi:hypothetical protein
MTEDTNWKKYVCIECGAERVKLWRRYNDGCVELRCKICTEKVSKSKLELPCDQIGWYVPACAPNKIIDGSIYYDTKCVYGYSSVPKDLCEWWGSLPYDGGDTPTELPVNS